MDMDEHPTVSERLYNPGLIKNPLTDFEDDEDFAAMGSGVSVASSEWRNVSSSSSSSSVEDQLTAKECVHADLALFVHFLHLIPAS